MHEIVFARPVAPTYLQEVGRVNIGSAQPGMLEAAAESEVLQAAEHKPTHHSATSSLLIRGFEK